MFKTVKHRFGESNLDVPGLHCPQPILRTRACLKEMKTGKVLQVIATDPGSVRDIRTFCKQTDNAILSSSTVAVNIYF
jgi:tRNA 2-thiouridine synthesizing protein A